MCSAGTVRFEVVPPEPGRFWIRHVPRTWPGADGWWIDLARAEPAADELRSRLHALPPTLPFGDLVYVPPVDQGAGLLHGELLQRCTDLGVPTLQQVLPHQPIAAAAGPVAVDLTESLLRRRPEELLAAEGTWAIWPLIPGLTDDEDLVAPGLERLAKAGVTGVLPIVPMLSPQVRRRLAEFGSYISYSPLFHRQASPQLARFSRRIGAHGLEVFPPRPPLADARRAPNRELAAHFYLLAEMWLGCGRPEGRAQVYFGVARRLDEEPLDVRELARRGGLAGISWMDAESLAEIDGMLTSGESRLLTELKKELFAGDGEI